MAISKAIIMISGLLHLLMAALASSERAVICTSGCPAALTSYPTIDSSLADTLSLPQVTLYLASTSENYTVLSTYFLVHRLCVQGNHQTLLFNASFVVDSGAELEIRDVIIGMEGGLEPALQIFGKVTIANCCIKGFEVPFSIVSGTFILQQVEVWSSTKELIVVTGEGSTVAITKGSVYNHTGTFLSAWKQPSALVMIECLFAGNLEKEAEALITLNFTSSSSSAIVNISDSVFRNNSIPLIYLNTPNTAIWVSNCSFLMNKYGGVTGYLRNSSLDIVSSTWDFNGGVGINLLELQGTLSLSNSSLSHQTNQGFIMIVGFNSPCFASLSHCVFSDTQVNITGSLAGVFRLEYCSGFVHNVSISEVSLMTDSFKGLRGLIYAFFGSLSVSNLYVRNAGSIGSLVGVGVGKMTLTDSYFLNFFTITGVSIGCVSSQSTVYNLTISKDFPQDSLNKSAEDSPNSIYLVSSTINLTHIHIKGNKKASYASISSIECEIEISHVLIESVLQDHYIIVTQSKVVIRDIEIRESSHEVYLLIFLHSDLTIHNAVFSNLTTESRETMRMFGFARLSTLYLMNATIENMEFVSLIAGKDSVALMENSTIRNCKVREGIIENINAEITLKGVLIETLRGHKLVTGFRGNSSFVSTTLRDIEVDKMMFLLFGGTVTIANSVLCNCHSHDSFGLFEQNSKLEISDSNWKNISSDAAQGFVLSTGHLAVRNSTFSGFQMSLFQVTQASVRIEKSRFDSGVNGEKSLKSKYIYGGVLGCVDCFDVKVDNIKVSNVTATYGGALSIRNSNQYPAVITNSLFIGCTANRGGAIFIENTSFRIETCTFLRNTAEKGSGGALEVDIRGVHENIVAHTVFANNVAREGGGIRWPSAEVHLLNVSFQENTADYGPDIASYGVTLSSNVTKLSGEEAPGVPFDLVLELLDHYGAVVSTAADKYVQLLETSSLGFLGSKLRLISHGLFNFTALTVFAKPGTSHDVIAQMINIEGNEDINIQTTIQIPFRNCTGGEVCHSDRCELCPPGYFSFSPSDSACRHCPSHAFCAGGNSMAVDFQYWRNASDSSNVVVCPLGDKCMGGVNSTCAEGFTGALCTQCAPDYYRFSGMECGKCRHWALTCLQVLATLCIYVLFLYGILRFSLFHPNNDKLFVLKTLISHTQYLTALTFLRVSFPSPIAYFLHVLSYLSSLLITDLPLSCMDVAFPGHVKAILGSSLLPATVLLSAVLIWRNKAALPHVIVILSAQMMFTPVLAVCAVLPLLSCYRLSSRELMFVDMREECWTSTHLTYVYALVVPSLLLNILVPLLGVRLGMKRENTFLSIWRSGYNAPLWDFFLLVSRIAFTGILIGSQVSPKLVQLCYGLIVLICTCVVNAAAQPYVYCHKHLFFLAEGSLVMVSVSQGLAVYYVFSTPGFSWEDCLISIGFVGINGIYIAGMVFFLVSKTAIPLQVKRIKNSEGHQVPNNSINSSISLN